ncbi:MULTISPECIES: class I SAM-dependent methyltransferase [Lysinibacillus]|uniref:class I SAM-dependent methyltransferase n=1 Tax=Lysinibacillus TaxID=400634 RepID=UPI0008263CA0|nr:MULTISPECIES: class I SAM-dependent methyltransferase [Lysinibacillus]MEC1305750.1 class I SAM-dependent methyltransferase [Lysinibacillus capsici]OCX65252.1 hypothetical protein BFM98_06565 [Lysinibacillus sp. AR18-8]
MGYKKATEDFITMDLSEMRPKGFLKVVLERQINNIKAVNEKSGWKERVNCPICGKDDSSFQFMKNDFSLLQCNNCKTAFFDKIPVNTDDLYSAEHALSDAQKAYLVNKDYRKVRFASERITLIESLLQKSVLNKNILDVGCGTGWFLEYAKEQGANCFGLELGKELSKFTEERLNIPIWNCELPDLETDVRFDVITMFDLIEHVVEPLKLIESAKKLLNDSGIILIFTPHFDSVAIQTMKDKSNLIMPAEHLSYFTKNTLNFIAEKTNMKVEYFATKGIDIGDLKSFYEYEGQHQIAETMEKMYDVLQPTIDHAENGNHLRAVLSK